MAKGKQIAALLKTDLSMSSDLAQIAKMLEKKGRGNDTMLAHITKREAQMLKDMGGAGTVNPETGLLEFYDEYTFSDYSGEIPYTPPDVSVGAPMQAPTIQAQPLEPTYGAESFYTPTAGAVVPPEAAPAAAPEVSPAYAFEPVGGYGLQPGGRQGVSLTPQQAAAFGPQMTVPEARTGYGLADRYVTPSAAQPLPPPQEKSFFEKLAGGLSTQDMIRLGLAGATGLLGAQRARVGAQQAQAGKQEMGAIAKPYQEQGQAMVGAAMRGELTPTGQQSLQALQARLAQGVEQRGGVGAAQAAAQIEAYRQQLLQGQYDYGLKVTNIGDQIALGAIRTGMQADQQLQQASAGFYTNLAAIAGGTPMSATARR